MKKCYIPAYHFANILLIGLMISSCRPTTAAGGLGVQVSNIIGIQEGDTLIPGEHILVYVEASGESNLTFIWEDANGIISSSSNSVLTYTVPNLPAESFIKVTVLTRSENQKFQIVRFKILQPTATPTITIPPSSTPTPSNTVTATMTITPTSEMKAVVIEYIAVSGDTLSSISRQFLQDGKFANALGRANCIDILKADQKVTIKYYIVREGEYLGLIAERFGMSIQFIQFINESTTETIYPGQIIILPIYGKCDDE